ncbi:MAG: hypothetical protein LBR45_00780 [Bacteroidales bacterium]|jgi:hypothetical protein|nr:hypothetical protein [Bacteroidales bacterium]
MNKPIDRERWAQLNIFQQMGNIGSEVGRAIKAKREGKDERLQGAIERALDLFSATVFDLINKHQSHRITEVLRSRDEFLGLFYDNKFSDSNVNAIESYFTHFAIASRLRVRKLITK